MMEQYNLPNELKGNWIWIEAERNEVETYGLFRKEFTLSELPNTAELWISARSFFHLFINGEHVSFGMDLCPVAGSYAWDFDISYLLNTGSNAIAVLAHNTNVPRSSCLPQPDGLWAQMDIDGKPHLWTDDSWQVQRAAGYAENRPRRSFSSAFTEKIDLRKVPDAWIKTAPVNDAGWGRPSYSSPIQADAWRIIPFPAPPMTVSQARPEEITARGVCHHRYGYTNLSFETMRKAEGDGVYGAETYLYSREPLDTQIQVYADNPCRLFVNGAAVHQQGVKPLAPGGTLTPPAEGCFSQIDETRTTVAISLAEGWNRLGFYENVTRSTCGMALVLPDFGAESLHLRREPSRDAMPGWCIAGPLQTPLANILGHLVLRELDNLNFFIPVEENPTDENALLDAFRFDPDQGEHRDVTLNETFTLEEGQYVVLTLPQCRYGCPSLQIAGSAGDLVDVVSSTELSAGRVPSCSDGQKNVDTLILADDQTTWIACHPRGVRYIMLVAREVAGEVKVGGVGVAIREYDFENAGHFESSDEALNRLWRTGQQTLSTTVQEIFMDSPVRDETQYVGDAMIQSWAAYHVFGDYGLAAKSLEEFAACQFETGEMPAACPSSFYLNIPDYALLWPVWLQQHYLYTGSRQHLEKLLGNLERLLAYFEAVTDGNTGVLGGMAKYGGYCFLDHAEMDRDGISTGLNALYSRALLSSASIMEHVGRSKDSENLRKKAGRTCAALRRLCWNSEKGLFADSYHDGHTSDSYSLQTNILAIYGGLAQSRNYGPIFDQLFTAEAPYYRNMPAATNNPYFNYFILETAFALGRRNWACNYMRWYWNSMIEAGAHTWWELYDPRKAPTEMFNGSACHGYGVSPNGFLIREIAGIRPAKPGFTSIYFNPLTSGIKSVKATVPTPYGHIRVEWELTDSNQLEAVIDANYPLSVIPELEPEVAASALIRVSDEVTVFGSSE